VGNNLHNYVSSNAPYKILLGEGTQDYRVSVDEPEGYEVRTNPKGLLASFLG
jgi:hypothetical protein